MFFGCKIEVSAHEGIDAEDNDFRPLEAELDEHHPKATRTLFVGNLEKDVSTSDLKSHFEQFGEIIVSLFERLIQLTHNHLFREAFATVLPYFGSEFMCFSHSKVDCSLNSINQMFYYLCFPFASLSKRNIGLKYLFCFFSLLFSFLQSFLY